MFSTKNNNKSTLRILKDAKDFNGKDYYIVLKEDFLKLKNGEIQDQLLSYMKNIPKHEIDQNSQLEDEKKLQSKINMKLEDLGEEIYTHLKYNKLNNCYIEHDLSDEEIAHVANGFLLKEWQFTKYKKPSFVIEDIKFYSTNPEKSQKILDSFQTIRDAIFWARELICTPANEMYPETMAEEVKNKLSPLGLNVEILNKKDLAKLGMNLLLGVSLGSYKEPKVIVIKKGNNPKLALIGKGVTFDTGGVSIKPSEGMEDMIHDMSGAAAVCASAVALSKENVEFIAIAGLVENMIGGNAQRPGDIWKSMNGKTVEVLNTDAEGRLILGDLVYYAGTLGCKDIITIATLTGAVTTALGNQYAGLMTNNKYLSHLLHCAGRESGEKLWPLPLKKEYDQFTTSKVADLQNITNGKGAGSTMGGKFIEALLYPGCNFAHIDIAGVCGNSSKSSSKYNGFGTRLLINFVKNYKSW